MKICAIICEYNPFHNGHLYQLNAAKAQSNADAIVCFMSGDFVQRGEAASLDKYTRAKHAVLAGADAVIQLPTVFSTSNAELFAKGGVHLLTSIPDVTTICFGAETVGKTAFLQAARYLANEPEEVSKKIKADVAQGISYAKARANAFAGFIPFDLLSSPNNILGLEYTKALYEKQSTVDILPIQRTGAAYDNDTLQANFSSASAIRSAINRGDNVTGNVPDFVAYDLPSRLETTLDSLEKYAILAHSPQEIARVCDCTEGLENAFKKAAGQPETLVSALTSARYTSSRIRRIALQNLLNIQETLIRDCLNAPLYLQVLAVKKERSDVLSALSKSSFPLLLRAHDQDVLQTTAKRCFEVDTFAEQVWKLLYPTDDKKQRLI